MKPGTQVHHPEYGNGIFIEHKDCHEVGVVFTADDGVKSVPESEVTVVESAAKKLIDDFVAEWSDAEEPEQYVWWDFLNDIAGTL